MFLDLNSWAMNKLIKCGHNMDLNILIKLEGLFINMIYTFSCCIIFSNMKEFYICNYSTYLYYYLQRKWVSLYGILKSLRKTINKAECLTYLESAENETF